MNYSSKLRQELKYYVSFSEYSKLKLKLSQIMEKDEFAAQNESYHVRSLYFDDVHDSALYGRSFDTSISDKFRIRIYNKSDSTLRLEKKSKLGTYSSKEAMNLSVEDYYKIIHNKPDFDVLSRNKVGVEFFMLHKNNLLRPKVIVDYDREAFVDKETDIRVSFDKQLRVGINSIDILSDDLVAMNVFDEARIVMEVKYTSVLNSRIEAALEIPSRENFTISKYIICRTYKTMK